MKITIVIPAYNEENRIGRTLKTYATYFQEQKDLTTRLLVVLNGCKDNTLGVVTDLQTQYPMITYLDLPTGGKGYAIATGFKDALKGDSDVIGFVDADMATEPVYFHDLVKNMGDYAGIVASRYMPGSQVFPPRPFIKYWGRRLIYDKLVLLLFGMNMHDFQCGAKLFKRHALEKIVDDFSVRQWAFDVELLYLNKKNGFSIKEIPTVWRDQADSKLNMMGSGMKMLSSIVKLRLRHSPFKKWVAGDL